MLLQADVIEESRKGDFHHEGLSASVGRNQMLHHEGHEEHEEERGKEAFCDYDSPL